jgi:peroxiredoxin
LRSFQDQIFRFDALGVRVLAVSVDRPEINQEHRRKLGVTYSLLSDANAETIKRYDLLHAGAGQNGADIARPAEFLVDSTGTVRWMNLTESIAVRLRPEQALQAAQELAR